MVDLGIGLLDLGELGLHEDVVGAGRPLALGGLLLGGLLGGGLRHDGVASLVPVVDRRM